MANGLLINAATGGGQQKISAKEIDDGGGDLQQHQRMLVEGEDAHDAALTKNAIPIGGYASAAAPTAVSADADFVRAWFLRNGAQTVVLTAAGALIGGDAANGIDVDVTRVTGTVTVDSELPTAAALADNASNPTVPAVGAFGMVWDGSTWDRQAGTSADGTLVNLGTNNDVTLNGAGTATLANINDAATSATLQASNVNRKAWSCFNDSTQRLYIKFGATASTTSFNVRVEPGALYEMPLPVYTGIIDGIWAADGTGAARVCELT